jgi:uroporphyrin-III C-methyltransferase
MAEAGAPFVYIVGAGPGSVDLLTYKAHQLLTSDASDVVVYDRLIPEEVLALIPDSVKKIYAGKSCRKHHMTQDEINQCLVAEASKPAVVVRLKGGDPFIFGRGGEEMLYLREHAIPYEVVPGVNAADGVAALLGIPLTHRGVAHAVEFITGHQQKGQDVTLDWKALANPNTTKVVFMGLANLEKIASELLEHGLSGNTPVAAIYKGSWKEQRHCVTTLSSMVVDIKAAELTAPTLIIIGQVVGLSGLM